VNAVLNWKKFARSAGFRTFFSLNFCGRCGQKPNGKKIKEKIPPENLSFSEAQDMLESLLKAIDYLVRSSEKSLAR
jgi:hypothetical protein